MRPRPARSCLAAAASAAIAIASPARAQSTMDGATGVDATAAPPESTAQPPAPEADASAPDAASLAVVTQAARAIFAEGVELTRWGRWEDARERFRRALVLRESPALHYNLALAAQNSGHFVEAVEHYQLFLAQDDDPANAIKRRDASTAVIEIERALAQIVVRVEGTDEVSRVYLDGQLLELSRLQQPVPVDPGDHVIEAQGTHGGVALQSVRLGAGQDRPILLVLDRPLGRAATATGGGSASAPVRRARPNEPPPTPRATGASGLTVARVRRAIEDRAATQDTFGRRRWENTFVFYAFQGTGNPIGLLGLGMRWAPRPWLDEEITAGAGHPFGPGVGASLTARFPWSYRYGIGLTVGVSTNFTYIQQGSDATRTCDSTSPFTPVWVMGGITQEWRVSLGFSYRFTVGLRGLVNNRELHDAQYHHCGEWRQTWAPSELFFDQPTLDHSVLPVMPWLSFDVGYSL